MLTDHFKLKRDAEKNLIDTMPMSLHSIDNLLAFITGRGQSCAIQVIAKSPEIHKLIVANPFIFTAYFSREAIKALIFQACSLGNLELARCLIDSIQLDVVHETIGNPFGSFRVLDHGDYEFIDQLPVIQAAAQSNSLDLIQYLISFYNLNHLDKSAIKGDLQGALAIASGNDAFDLVNYLLDCGVNANSVVKEAHTISALRRAVLTGSMALIKLLIEHDAKITELDQYIAVKNARLDVVTYFVSQGALFKDGVGDLSIMTAFESLSVNMVQYCLNTLKFNLYPTNGPAKNTKTDWERQIIKKVLRSGSVEMLAFIENELRLPVRYLLHAERQIIRSLHPLHGRSLFYEAVSSYNVMLLKFLFETLKLLPSVQQLEQLASYAFDSSSIAIRHQKFLTHVYLNSFFHEDQLIRKLMRDVSELGNLQYLSLEELFMLYAEYTKNFNEVPLRLEYGNKFSDNAIYLANEISRRNPSSNDMLELAQQKNAKLLPAVRFYLTVTSADHSTELLRKLMQPTNRADGHVNTVIGSCINSPSLAGETGLSASMNQVSGLRRTPLRFFETRDAHHANQNKEALFDGGAAPKSRG